MTDDIWAPVTGMIPVAVGVGMAGILINQMSRLGQTAQPRRRRKKARRRR